VLRDFIDYFNKILKEGDEIISEASKEDPPDRIGNDLSDQKIQEMSISEDSLN
jgi:hypothetical protein